MPAERSVVITGTSTGIGRATALRLDRAGFDVYAGVRRESDGEALRLEASERLTPLLLDVTDPTSIELAAKRVEAAVAESGLGGLVNNAGIGIGGPLEFVEIQELRRQLEVNLIGPVAVTQAFLPLLRPARGRVVNVSSAAGRVASPFQGPYAASKFALEAFSDSLRLELRSSGVGVVVVEPGFIQTPMIDKSRREMDSAQDALPEQGLHLYGEAIDQLRSRFEGFAARGAAPDKVARAIQRALTAGRPRHRYLVGFDARIFVLLDAVLPGRIRDAVMARMTGL